MELLKNRGLKFSYLGASVFFLVLSTFSFGNVNALQFIFRVGGLSLSVLFALLFFFSRPKSTLCDHTYAGRLNGLGQGTRFKVSARVFYIFIAFFTIASTAAISAVWAPDPIFSLWKSIEILLVLIVVSLLFSRINCLRQCWHAIHLFFLSLQIILLSSISLNVILGSPDFTLLAGYFPIINPNSVGALSALCVIYYFVIRRFSFACFWLLIVLMSGSRTALIALLLCLLLQYVILKSQSRLSAGINRVIAGGSFFLIVGFLAQEIAVFWEEAQELSGRRIIWESYINFYTHGKGLFDYVFGIGIGSTRSFYNFIDDVHRRVSFHNAWLEVFVSSGVIALFMFFIIFIYCLYFLLRLTSREGGGGVLARVLFFSLVLISVRSFSASNFSSLTPELVLLFFISFTVVKSKIMLAREA